MHKLILFIILGLTSCTVTNNLYLNDPVSLQKGEINGYFGFGTGRAPKIDSVNDNGDVFFQHETVMAPTMNIGGQGYIAKNTQLRAALHLPYIIGGLGIRVGSQYSFLNNQKSINAAFGFDLGGVYAHDSIKIFGDKTPLSINSNGAVTFDTYLPVSIKTGENSRIIFTPRYSYSAMYIRKNRSFHDARVFSNWYPSMSVAIIKNNFAIEFSTLRIKNQLIPNFGIVHCFNIDD